tara:strand:+ start:167 stop:949 length:783 start_codon:yes stop_codon:yes gene_type:complete
MNELKRLIFKVESLKKSYGSFEALNIKKLEIHPGTVYAIVGPPGSGKTTLLNILSGSLKPSSGSLFFENMPYETNWLGKIIKHDEVFYNYGYEEFGSRLKVSKVIRKLYGKKSNTLMKRHFNSTRFKHLWDRPISNLTKGELHWFGMILSLESDPRVLLIDEYGAHLTDEIEQEFRSQLNRMNRSLGTTIIISSHSESLVKKFASVIIFLDNGHISKIRSSSSRKGRLSGSDRKRKSSNYKKRNRNYRKKQKQSGNNKSA